MKFKFLAASSSLVLLLLIFFMAGCQQEDQVTPGSKLTDRAQPTCTANNPTWSNNAACAGQDLTVTVCFNATCGEAQIQYESAPGVWTQLAHENPLTGSCLTITPIVAAGIGTYNFRTQYQSSGSGCNFCAVQWEGSNQNPNSYSSVTVVACDEEVCYGPAETGWSNGPEYAEGRQWATYTAVGSFPATLYASQTSVAGTVSYAGGMITITLAAGWEFANVSENVKIQAYSVAPTTEPTPGLFDNKTTAAIGSSPYSVAVAAGNYYGVHVDLVPIIECP